MGIDSLFELTKLKILGFTDPERSSAVPAPAPAEFVAMFNPESLTRQYKAVGTPIKNAQGQVTTYEWHHAEPSSLKISLLLDGTNVSSMGVLSLFGDPPTVAEQIEGFLAICYVTHSKSHEPAYLKLIWNKDIFGGKEDFRCRLQSVDINYTMFDRDGAPLRAVLDATFVEALTVDEQKKELNANSPDLSHSVMVKAGDTLPQLCRQIYGSSQHYLRVAEVNGLDDFRRLTPGTTMIFPPYDRRGRA